MARLGLNKHHKVISSGRLAGSAKGRKRAPGRQVSVASDSGYSLYSTDSEDQVTTIHKGLDRCAALLQDAQPATSKLRKTVVKSKPRVTFGKGENGKRKPQRKTGLIGQAQKEAVAVKKTTLPSNSCPGMKEDGCVNSVETPVAQPVLAPFAQHFSEAQPALCKDVQTQMSLMSYPVPGKGSLTHPGSKSSTAFNCRLTTSTPTLSPQKSGSQHNIQTNLSNDVHCQAAFQGGHSFFPSQTGPVTTSPAVLIEDVEQSVPQPRYSKEMGDSGHTSHESLQEQAMLRQIQVHLAHLQQETNTQQMATQALSQGLQPLSNEAAEYTEETTSDEEETDSVDIMPVRDTGCQTSFDRQKLFLKSRKMSPEQTAKKVKTVKYLLGELKTLVADQDDSEILRLIAEVEDCVSLLPAMVGSTNVQAEIALSLQPLRSENAQLRRRLRIVNQQLRERERAEKESRPVDCNFEVISLQAMIMTLQSQLKESHRSAEALQRKNEELLQSFAEQQRENLQLRKAMEDKERELQQNRQRSEADTARVKMDVEEALSEMKSCQFKLEASEKENHILAVSLQQRDAEVGRLRELSRSLQGSMANLVSELKLDNKGLKPNSHLTKNILDLYEYQQKGDLGSDPVSDSINMYLKTLEANQHRSNLGVGPVYCYSNETAAQSSWRSGDSSGFPKENGSSVKLTMLPKTGSSGLGREPELEKAIYIPFTDTMKKQEQLCDAHKVSPLQARSNKSPDDYKSENDDETLHCDPKSSANAFKELQISNVPFPCRVDSLNSPGKFGADSQISSLHKNRNTNHIQLHHFQDLVPHKESKGKMSISGASCFNSTFSSVDIRSLTSDCSMSSVSTLKTCDEQDFRNGLAALDASIASLQKTIQSDLKR
ncbi:coiled-coil domain-containing protein 14 isoform X2 [Amia ocellicauda]|uniref:coiled-coil domain-containing protein 14 isoform X2 n=1 Tax=Amia ocellicauda TaxID=2972642 RepID=UPI0034648F69